jgi:acetamidase/formamidase
MRVSPALSVLARFCSPLGPARSVLSRLCPLVLLAVVAPAAAAQSRPHFHHLAATPETVAWGYYSAAAKPVLRVASGDTVEVETLITNSPQGLERAGLPPNEVQQSLRDITTKVTDKGPGGHILTGPIYIDGAEPGDVLEVRILGISFPIAYAYNGCAGFLPQNCGQPRHSQIIPLDTVHMTATIDSTIQVPMRPFFGSIGDAPPPDSGRLSSNPPGTHAGNMDNRSLTVGTTLYIPVHAPGALLEIGDGHAAQGDGEVDQTAIETSLTGRFQVIVRKDLHFEWPRAETPTELMTMGMDKDLTQATRVAVQQMVDLLGEQLGLPHDKAYALASVAADLKIAELVDGNMCVYMTIPKKIAGPTFKPEAATGAGP